MDDSDPYLGSSSTPRFGANWNPDSGVNANLTVEGPGGRDLEFSYNPTDGFGVGMTVDDFGLEGPIRLTQNGGLQSEVHLSNPGELLNSVGAGELGDLYNTGRNRLREGRNALARFANRSLETEDGPFSLRYRQGEGHERIARFAGVSTDGGL